MSVTSSIKKLSISVRALADFNQIEGDLIGTYRPSPSAFEGQLTHKLTQQNRGTGYESEVTLKTIWIGKEFELTITGRADGVYQNGIEEIKATRIPPEDIPDVAKQLHLAQAKIYGALYALLNVSKTDIEIKVTYVHSQSLQEWSIESSYSSADLIDEFITLCSRYDQWLIEHQEHKSAREAFLEQLSFPYPSMRSGQRQMAESVDKACCTGKDLTVEAPTGTGKTLASLFPALKSFQKTKIESLFFLTMKTTGKVAAQDALKQLDPDNQLSVVFLSAKKRLCLNEGSVCDGEFCPYAKDYYAKRHNIRSQLLDRVQWNDEALLALGEKETVCPYYLSQDWAIWSDIVVGDINYIYDTTAVQPYLLKEIDNKATILIDESHNLIDRGRMIYSSEFSGESLQALLKETTKPIQKALKKIQSKLRAACADQAVTLSYEPPTALCQTLRDFVSLSPVLLRENQSYTPGELWQEFIFSCARFTRLHELAKPGNFCWRYFEGPPKNRRVELICLNPGELLAAKHDLVNNVIAFSATLKPWAYSNQLNGLSDAVIEELPSPFSPKQYNIYIANDISTRFKNKHELPEKLNQTLDTTVNSNKNSMVFFSSYQQLKSCTQFLTETPLLIIQQSDWYSTKREEVLHRFKNEQGLTLMTVLGGVFSEGIDLPHTQLEEVIIVGPGLPQVNEVNNAVRDQMNQQNLPGFDFAYAFPGLQKVLQAAGRCVRTETDFGRILLIDDRFEEYWRNQWLPNYWTINSGPLAHWS
jgi:DNA excision repair protein ERCC-2